MDTWGMLPKSQKDPETIEQAISRMISNHEADSEAHLGAGESLETHRDQEIIDHKAESIVPDKMRDAFSLLGNNVNAFFSFDPFYMTAYSSAINLMTLNFRTAATLNDIAFLCLSAYYFTEAFFYSNPWLILPARFGATGTHEIYFGIGDHDIDFGYEFAGFKITGGYIYAETCDGNNSNRTSVQVSPFTSGDFHIYKIVVTSGEKVDFYIDGALVATITTNLPENTGFIMFAKLKSTQASKYVYSYIHPFSF